MAREWELKARRPHGSVQLKGCSPGSVFSVRLQNQQNRVHMTSERKLMSTLSAPHAGSFPPLGPPRLFRGPRGQKLFASPAYLQVLLWSHGRRPRAAAGAYSLGRHRPQAPGLGLVMRACCGPTHAKTMMALRTHTVTTSIDPATVYTHAAPGGSGWLCACGDWRRCVGSVGAVPGLERLRGSGGGGRHSPTAHHPGGHRSRGGLQRISGVTASGACLCGAA